jgi:hypothetical protein
VRTAVDFASICAGRSSYRARSLHSKPSRPQYLYFLHQTLPDFARDAAGFGVGIHSGTAPQSLHAAQPFGAGHGGANIQFNAWKPHYSSEMRLIEPGFHVSTGQRQPVASSRRYSSGSLPRVPAPDLSSSFHGFIASDDGGSSAFSDSSDVEVDARSSVNARLSPASARSGGRLSAQRRPHTSSGLVGDANSDSRSLRPFHEQTSSARSLSTAALLRARGQRQPVASSRRYSSGSLPRVLAPDLSSSFHGFIASDDGGSSAFSDSSDVEVDARSSVNARLSPASARSGGRLSAQRRPHTSSGLVGDANSDSRSLRLFHEQTSSARSLSTAALLRALSSSESNVKPLQVSFIFHTVFTRWTHNWNLTPYFR